MAFCAACAARIVAPSVGSASAVFAACAAVFSASWHAIFFTCFALDGLSRSIAICSLPQGQPFSTSTSDLLSLPRKRAKAPVN